MDQPCCSYTKKPRDRKRSYKMARSEIPLPAAVDTPASPAKNKEPPLPPEEEVKPVIFPCSPAPKSSTTRLLAICATDNFTKLYIDIYDGKRKRWRHYSKRFLKYRMRNYRCEFLNRYLFIIAGKFESHAKVQHQIQFADVKLKNLRFARRMNSARSNQAVAVVGEYLYCIGGLNAENECLDSVELYNPYFETWTFVKPLSIPRAFCSSAVLNNFLYVINGCDGTVNPQPSHSVDRFDPITNNWESLAPMKIPSVPLGTVAHRDSIYVMKREGIECYNTATNTWGQIESDLADFKCHPLSLCVHNNLITVMSKEYPTAVRQYDPEMNEWYSLPDLQGNYDYGVLLTVPEEHFQNELSFERLHRLFFYAPLNIL